MSQTVAMSVFTPAGKPSAVITVVHGMAEHRKRYDAFAKYLQKNGYAVLTYDLPGHGESIGEEGVPGYFGADYGWQNLLQSAVEAVKEAGRRFPNTPVVLFGHSMGTIIARCLIQEHDDLIDGLILSGAPNAQSAAEIGRRIAGLLAGLKGKKAHSRLLDQLVTGNFNKKIKDPKTPLDWLSFNEQNVADYQNDPLCGFPFTVQGYADELEGLVRMAKQERYAVKNRDLRILAFAGEEDPCIGGNEGWSKTLALLRHAGYTDIEARLYPHMRHETLNEKYNLSVYQDVRRWLDARIRCEECVDDD